MKEKNIKFFESFLKKIRETDFTDIVIDKKDQIDYDILNDEIIINKRNNNINYSIVWPFTGSKTTMIVHLKTVLFNLKNEFTVNFSDKK
jgi:hypothetical protein